MVLKERVDGVETLTTKYLNDGNDWMASPHPLAAGMNARRFLKSRHVPGANESQNAGQTQLIR